MDIRTNVLLKDFTTMKLGGPARFMGEAGSADDVIALYHTAKSQNLPVFILGGGSNIIAHDEGFEGFVIRVLIPGFDIINDDENTTTIKIGAGESWDKMVEQTVRMHLSGIEAMSAVPGTVGAAPVQNVGAYGQEIADTLVSLVAYDTQTDQLVTLQKADCGFSYRHSIFRGAQKGRYIITSITLKLSKLTPQPPFYEAVQAYFDEHNIHNFTPEAIRQAVMAIRTHKLPDPNKLPNAGSFFKNVIVDQQQLTDLHATYPTIPAFAMGDGHFKLSTGWLIEQTGLKGKVFHGIKVHDKNALVLINESAMSYQELAAAREEIIDTVRNKFNIQIEQEPLEI